MPKNRELLYTCIHVVARELSAMSEEDVEGLLVA